MTSNTIRIALLSLGFLGSIAFAGYLWNRKPVYGEIAGRVTRGGVPLEHVQVVFYPEEDGPRSTALTDKDGHFETMTDANQKVLTNKGAPVGKYRVTLVDRRDQMQAMDKWLRDVEANAGGRDPKRLGSLKFPLGKMKNASGSVMRIPERYNQRLDTPFNDIEIKPGKNWFDLDVK